MAHHVLPEQHDTCTAARLGLCYCLGDLAGMNSLRLLSTGNPMGQAQLCYCLGDLAGMNSLGLLSTGNPMGQAQQENVHSVCEALYAVAEFIVA